MNHKRYKVDGILQPMHNKQNYQPYFQLEHSFLDEMFSGFCMNQISNSSYAQVTTINRNKTESMPY